MIERLKLQIYEYEELLEGAPEQKKKLARAIVPLNYIGQEVAIRSSASPEDARSDADEPATSSYTACVAQD